MRTTLYFLDFLGHFLYCGDRCNPREEIMGASAETMLDERNSSEGTSSEGFPKFHILSGVGDSVIEKYMSIDEIAEAKRAGQLPGLVSRMVLDHGHVLREITDEENTQVCRAKTT